MRISIRLRPGTDNDLIKWIEKIGEGDRSYHIRAALRAYLNGPQDPPPASIGEPEPGPELSFKEREAQPRDKKNLGQKLDELAEGL